MKNKNRIHSIRQSLRRGRLVWLALILFLSAAAVFSAAADSSPKRIWQRLTASFNTAPSVTTPAAPAAQTAPAQYNFQLPMTDVARMVSGAPLEASGLRAAQSSVQLTLPMPDGQARRYRLLDSPIIAPELAAKYPDIKSYTAQGVEDPSATARFSWTSRGLHGVILGNDYSVFIHPVDHTTTTNYVSYYAQQDDRFECGVTDDTPGARSKASQPGINIKNGGTLRVYRLAIATPGEYTTNPAYGGGTVASTVASLNVWVNQMNAEYERELAIRFTLVNNTSIIYTNAATDPFTNPTSTDTSLTEVRATLASVVGAANYDLGHVLLVGDTGGLAYSSVVCDSAGSVNKGGGVSGVTLPLGSAYGAGRLMHETAHQFGVSHTFNDGDGCATNRSPATAYESGGGLSIMAYPHACLFINSTSGNGRVVYFHDGSLTQAVNYIAGRGGTCGTTALSGNTPPTVSGGPDRTIPRNTPFTLTATGSDSDVNDAAALTYSWEQIDAGGANFFQTSVASTWKDAGDPSNTTRPIFRPFAPTSSPSRTFPSLTYILNNANVPPDKVNNLWTAEHLPNITRQINFRVILRDNRASGGAFADDHVVLNVDGNSGPFLVTAPNTATSLPAGSMQTVTWNVNNTNLAPVNCANVKISLSTDGGQTFPTVLAASTPNDGSEVVTLPALASTVITARIKVEAADNIFFDISDANFTITSGVSCPTVTSFAPAAGNTGTSVKIFGTGFTSATAVKFSNNISATFTVNSDNQITVTQPAGAASGPITISKSGCADTVTTAYLVCPSAPATLSVDDNGIEQMTSVRYAVNRLTPAGYPATLQSVSIRIESTQNIQPGFPFILLYGVNADGDTDINNTSFQTMNATVGTLGTFVKYDLPQPITIQSGDFVVGYTFPNGGQTALLDTSAPQGRSYASSDGLNFTTNITPNNTQANLFIRAGVLIGCGLGAATCPTVSGISPTSGQIGDTVTITGAGFSGVTGVKFNSNIIANFTVVSDTQITAVVPPGTTSGAITISEPNCSDALTAGFTVNAPVCLTVTGFSPASALPGVPITITGTNFTGVSVVKFSSDQAASFTVDSPTQITAIVPPGVGFGPITISKQGCADVQTANFTPCNTNLPLQVDDGVYDTASGFAGPTTAYYVNRLTPAVYPATLTTVQVYMTTTAGPSASTPITILAAANSSGSSTINGISFQTQASTFGTLGQYNSYALNSPITINSGDFVIGFSVAIPSGSTWFVEVRDTTSPQGRSYRSTNAGATFTIPSGNPNYLIRGVYQRPCCSGVTVSVNPSNPALPGGQLGTPYSQTFTQTGGAGSATWSVSAGALPAGLTLNPATGALTGTPTAIGTSNFTIRATDQNSCTGERAYTLSVTCPAIAVSPGNLPDGTVGAAYNQSLSAAPAGTYSFAVTGGALPGGLTLSTGGALTGTPTQSGSFNFTVTATGFGGACTGTRTYAMTVACPIIAISPSTLPDGTVGAAYNHSLTGGALSGAYTFAVTSGALPTGVTLNANGTFSGSPTTATGSPFTFTVTATHTASGCTGGQTYVVNVACPTIALSTLPGATIGDVYSQTVTATPAGSYSFAVTNGVLPTGLTLAANGALSGTATVVGVFNFTITATGAGGCTGQQGYSVTISSPYCAPTPANLTGWWKAEGNPSDVNNANNGTLSGSVSFASGKVGQAFSFNGSNGYVLLPGSAFPTAQPGGGNLPFTFELWFKTSSSGVIMGQEDTLPYTGPNNLLANIYVGTNGKLYTEMFCCQIPIASAATVNDNVFHHVAVVFDGTNELTYVDGSLDHSVPFTQTGISTFFSLGTGNAAGRPNSVGGWWNFTGLIDEPTVYSRALTATEIQSIVTAGSRGKCETCTQTPANLTSWWKAENNSSDATNANNGTLQGSATFAAGKVNQAFSFNGTNGYVQLPDNFFPHPSAGAGNTSFTFETWFKTSGSGIIFGQQIATPYATPQSGYAPGIYVGNNGKLHVEMFWNGNINPIMTAASVNDGVFHHVAVVYNGTTETVYVDGSLAGSAAHTQQSYDSGSYHYQFGTGLADGWPNASSGWFNFTGLIDEPTLYSRALTAGEVQSIVNAGSAGKCCSIAIAQTSLPNGTLAVSYNQTITTNGSVGAATFTSSGTLPLGLTLSSGGVLSGTPTQAGLFNFSVTATDTANCSASQSFTVAVNCPTIAFSPVGLPVGAVGAAYSQTITASPGSYSFAVTAGALPAGLMLTSGGALTGTPMQAGTFAFTVTASNNVGGCQANQVYQLQVDCPIIALSPSVLPNGTVGAGYSQTITTAGLAGVYVFALDDGALPTGLTLNPATGQLSGTLTQGGTFSFVVSATHTASGCRGSQAFSVTAVCPTINITPTTLTAGFVGTVYNQSLTAGGGTPAYTFAQVSGSLPAGLSLGANGAVTGTPSLPGLYNFTVTATDNYGCVGTANISLTIGGCNVITVNPPAVSAGTLGTGYSQAFTQSGGQGATTFSTPGPLPAGITLSSGGVLSGTPTQTGVFPIIVTATDAFNCTGTVNFTLTINCPTITLSALTGGTAGTAYSQTLTALPAGGGYSFAVTAGSLPPGLSLNNTSGLVSGTPLQAGTFNFTVTASGSGGFGSCTGAQAYSVAIACPAAITLSPTTLPAATGGVAYSQTLTAAPAGTAYTFAVTNGALPAGLTLAANGTLSGTTTQSGSFSFRVTATGFGGCSGFQDYTLAVGGCSPITVDPATLPGGTVGTAYNQTVNGNPAGTYSYSVTAGALPTGLTLNAATGAITGTPSQRGTYNFTILATSGSCTGSRAYSVVIGCPSLTVTALPSGTVGTAYNSGINVNPAGSYTYSVSSGSLPAGLTLNTSTGVISGTPTTVGSSTFTIRITASGGCIYGANYTVAVNCPTITLSSLTTPTLNAAYNQTVTATPAGGNYSYAVTTGVLPTGLTLNQISGAISGTPTVAGTFNFTITATGFGTCTGSRSYSFTIAPGACPTITLASLSGGNVGQLYTASVAASPSGTYSYAVTAGALPPGLTLYTGFGLLNGYPTTEGSFNFTITATDINNCTGQQAYTVVIGGVLRIATTNDFTGDRRSDFALWRADQQQWLIVDGASNATQTLQWGQAGDSAVAGDFDGDGKADPAVFGKDGHWRVKLSGNGATLDKLWGQGSDTPAPGDYDGDGKTDLAVWRGADTNWYIQRSSDGQIETKPWGSSLAPYFDIPVPGDYDGDGKTDIAVFRQSNGHWYIRQSSDGAVLDKAWGLGTDVPVAADYDGDGKTDIAVWRGSEGVWYIIQSSNGALKTKFWGAAYAPYHDLPITGDYDGDGKTDFAVWRQSDNRWYIVQSTDGATRIVSQGRTGDAPIGGR